MFMPFFSAKRPGRMLQKIGWLINEGNVMEFRTISARRMANKGRI